MKNKQKVALYWAIAIVIVASVIGALVFYSNQPGPLDTFAKCLGDQESTFYGAYWCPACNQQKTLFGKSQQHLPYVECSEPGSRDQNETCIEAGIQAYPTWEFANGERIEGVLSPEQLAQLTTCQLPQ
ncbi:MAG: hypothetical protein Q8P99_02855 [bacterium]|nr:hypothetical protein [bacterium]MDZ4231344.1 hypothetical protein [Patescibacteria group bacterium]